MSTPAPAGLGSRLREAAGEELLALVRSSLQELDASAACQALRNPFATAELIEVLLTQAPALLRSYDFRRDAAMHPRTPEFHALRLVSGLFWNDLVRLGLDVRVRPVVRRAADQRLAQRLTALAIGERVAVARQASAAVLSVLRYDPTPRVIAALLENPRASEGLLLPLLASEEAQPAVLALIAANPRFGARHGVRAALARNHRTPVATALGLLPGLRKSELETVANEPRLSAPVRRRARLLLGDRG